MKESCFFFAFLPNFCFRFTKIDVVFAIAVVDFTMTDVKLIVLVTGIGLAFNRYGFTRIGNRLANTGIGVTIIKVGFTVTFVDSTVTDVDIPIVDVGMVIAFGVVVVVVGFSNLGA